MTRQNGAAKQQRLEMAAKFGNKEAQSILAKLPKGGGEADGREGDWTECDHVVIREFMQWWLARGGAMMFSLSRDKFALCLTLFDNGAKAVKWFKPSDGLTDEVWAYYQQLRALAELHD